MDNGKSLYKQLSSDKLYTKSYDEFVKQYGNPEGQKELFNKLSADNLYSKSEADFVNQYWAPVKKKDQAKPTPSVSKSVSAPTKSLSDAPLKTPEKPEEVGYVEDIWNRFKGSGTKVLSAFLNVPSAAQSYIYDVALAATGKDEEFNRLPAVAKKEVKNAVRAVSKGLPNSELTYQTKEAANYLNKKAENIYQRTINDETSLSDEISKLTTNPTSEGVLKIVNKSIRSTAESLPYMITSMVPGGAAAIGVATAAEKREQELEETGNYGMGFLINSAVTGGSNYLGEKYTGRILNKIGAKSLGNPELLKKVTQAPLVELGKDLGIEFSTEALQSFTQEVSDKWTKGQEVQWIPTLKKALDDGLLGAASVGTFAAGGKGVQLTGKVAEPLKKYLASKIINKKDASYINKGIDAIQELNTQKADDQDPIVNEAIDNKINEIKTKIASKIQVAEDMIDNMSDEEIKKAIRIDRDLEDTRLKAKAIEDNPTLDDDTKELLRKDLADKYINLNKQRDAIQEQATSQIPVQPEAGVSGEVAEGITQAEPQVPTEEVKVEEVATPTTEIVAEEVKPTEMSQGEWTKLQNLADRISNGEDISSAEDLQLQQNYPVAIESLLSKKVKPVEQQAPEVKTKLSDTQKTAIQEAVKRGDDMVKRYPKQDDLILKYKALQQFQKKNQEYINADQSQKDEMTRQINYALGLAAKKSAPSVKSALGIKPTMVTVDQMESLKDQLMLQEKAAKGGVDFANKAKKLVNATIKGMKKGALDARTTNSLLTALDAKAETPEQRRDIISKVISIFKKTEGKIAIDEIKLYNDQIKIENKASQNANKIRNEVVSKIKSFVTRGVLSKAQQKSLLNSLAKTNILNPGMRDRLFERMQKMFERADYQDRVKEATTYRNRIKKLAKSETLQGSVAKMAKEFSKVIPEFTDIDTYLDNAREVYGAIKSPIRKAAVIDSISEFSKKELAKQEERLKNTLLDQYSSLVDEGKIDASMSLAEIQKYVMDVEAGTAPDTIDNEAEIRGNINELFNSMLDITDSILKDGYNPLTNEDVELDAYTKKLLKDFTSMDLDLMSIRDSYRATEALENYIVNDIIDNMETMYKNYMGAEKAKNIENKGIVANSFRRVFGGKPINYLSRMWTSAFSPVKSILDLVHRSRKVGSEVFDAMGLRDLSNANSQANAIADRIEEPYYNKFKNLKPNGKSFNDIENVFERETYAYLKRSVNGTVEQKQAEFERRKNIIEESIQELLNSGDSKLVKKGKIEDAIYDKIRSSSNPEQVGELVDPINKDASDFWINVYKGIYPEVKQIASSVYNTVLEDDVDYTPDIFEQIVEKEVGDVGESSVYKMAFDFLNQKPSGTLMKNNRIKSLPKGRVLSFDFDYNNSVALRKMLVDIKTAPYVQQYRGFTQSPSFEKIYPDPRDRSVIKDRLNYYVNEVRSKNVATGSVDAKAAAKIIQSISRYGTSRALGSLTSFFKQGGTALANTAINLANDPTSMRDGFMLLYNKDATKVLEESGYGIASRGLESQTAIESANKIIEKADLGSSNKAEEILSKSSELIGRAGKIYLDNFLKKGDIVAARASWFAYYLHDLKKQGINTKDIDWKNHELNKKAADYAEDQVNLQQNVSDSAMMGKFLTTKNPWTTIARSMILPFSSFIFNAKDKITTDVTILTSKASNKQDKIDAFKSLSATSFEMVLFEAFAATINSGIVIAANSILGYDESEEEKEKRIGKYVNTATTKFATDVLSPIPNIGDTAIVALINSLADLAQSDLDEEEKFKLFEYKPQSSWDALLSFIGGVPEIAVRPFVDMSNTINMITSDTYTDRFGNEIEFSYEDKSKLVYVLAVELLAATNILPTEAIRLNEKVKQKIEKEAR